MKFTHTYILLFTLGLILICCCFPQEALAQEECSHACTGDVNGDGIMTPEDALLAYKHTLGIEILSGCPLQRANRNGVPDEIITSDDVRCIFKDFLEDPCPVPEECVEAKTLNAIPGASPLSGVRPLTVTFTPGAYIVVGNIVSYEWDYEGDTVFEELLNVPNQTTHIYNAAGSYNACLKITDNFGNTDSTCVAIEVTNPPPTVTASASPTNGPIPLAVDFSGSASSPNGDISLYEWDFDGDGTYDWSSDSAPDTNHIYSVEGTFNTTLRVTDEVNMTATATVIIRALPEGSPTVTISADPTSGISPLVVNFNGSATTPSGTITLYEWDFNGDGTYDWSSTDNGTTIHTYNLAGTFQATFKVTASNGLTGMDSLTVAVGNRPPVATAEVNPSNGAAPLMVTLEGSGSDADGVIVLYEWDFEGDGVYDWSSASTGTASYSYTTPGVFHPTLRVTDNLDLQDTASKVVNVGEPGSPIADASAHPRSGFAPLTVFFTADADDPDGDIFLTYEWDFDGDGTYEVSWFMIPIPFFHNYFIPGTYTAFLRVTDSTGLTGIDTVVITVGEDPDPDPPDPCSGTGSPVYMKSGSLVKGVIDLSLQACGMPIKATRVYMSFNRYSGTLGYGWTLSYSMRLFEAQTSGGQGFVLVVMSNGQRYRFFENSDGSYTAPAGSFFTLKKENSHYLLEDNAYVYTFNGNGLLASIKDKAGNTVTLTYQTIEGCPDKITDRNGRGLTFTCVGDGRISQVTDPAGNSVSYTYDAHGDLVKVTGPEGGETLYTYDAHHNLLTSVNPEGETTLSVTYEAMEPYKVANYSQQGETYTISYVSDNQTNKINSQSQVVKYEFSESGQITKITSPMNHVIVHEYDADRNYTTFIDQNSNATSFSYDTNRHLTSVRDALGNKYLFTYDDKGNILTETDPLGRVAQFSYDEHSNLIRITRANDDEITMSYDEKGYITSMSKGVEVLTFEHDTDCNVTRMASSGGSEALINSDTVGNTIAITQNGATTTLTYTTLNKIASVTQGAETTSLDYDSSGRVTTVTYPDSKTLGYSYGSLNGFINQITYPDGSFSEYDYYSFGKFKTRKNELGDITTYGYDADHRPTLVVLSSGRIISYEYDNAATITKIVDSELGTITFTYDPLNRITSISQQGVTHTFTYDTMGNRVEKVDENGVTTYGYDVLHRLTELIQPDGTTTNFNPPLSNLPHPLTLNGIIGLYNSRQNIRLLSFLMAYTPEQIVRTIGYDLQFNRVIMSIDHNNLPTGLSPLQLRDYDSSSITWASSLMEFLSEYKRLGLGW